MSVGRRVVVELVAAVAAIAGAVYSASRVRTVVDVAPIIAGEPSTTSVVFRAPWLSLTLLLTTVAGVLIVLAVARWRRERGSHPG